jgi:hypothetical protein
MRAEHRLSLTTGAFASDVSERGVVGEEKIATFASMLELLVPLFSIG